MPVVLLALFQLVLLVPSLFLALELPMMPLVFVTLQMVGQMME